MKFTKYITEEVEKMDDLEIKILEWFAENPYPEDKKVHAFAKELNVEDHEFERHIYAILSSIVSEGKTKGKSSGKYDEKELEMGIKIEMEHTTFPAIAKKIARDHLSEIPDYYTRLAKMEKEAGVKD